MFRSLFGLCFLLSSFAWSQTAALAPSPGKARWSVKTSLMPGAHATSSGAKAISYDDLSTLPVVAGVSTNDSHFQSKRIPSSMTGAQISEGTLVKTRGWLQLIALEGDGDYHIQISSSKQRADKCVIVEVPNSDPAFVSSPELQAQFAAV